MDIYVASSFWILQIKLNKCPCGIIKHHLGIYPLVLYLGLKIGIFLIFWTTAILFSKVSVEFAFPPTMEEWYVCSTSLPACLSLLLLVLDILTGVMCTHFDFHLPERLVFFQKAVYSANVFLIVYRLSTLVVFCEQQFWIECIDSIYTVSSKKLFFDQLLLSPLAWYHKLEMTYQK